MLVSKAGQVLFRNAVWNSENIVSLGVVRGLQNTSQSKQFLILQKRYKKTSSDEKKRCEENPKKSRKLVKLATIAVVGTTVAVIAAKYDDDFRDWTKEQVPELDSLVKIVFQEEETYLESLDRLHKELSGWIKNALYDLFKGSKQGKQIMSRPGDDDFNLEPSEESQKPLKIPESAFLLKDDENKEQNAKILKHPSVIQLKNLEDSLNKTAAETYKSMNSAASATKDFAKLVDYLDQIINSDNPKLYEKLGKAREDAIKKHEISKNNLAKFRAIEKQYASKLNENEIISDDIKETAKKNVVQIELGVNEATSKLNKEKQNNFAKRSWEKCKQGRLHFAEELETLFPNVWFNDEKLNVPPDQLDPFTHNVYTEIDFLSQELSKLQAVSEVQIGAALERFKKIGQEAQDSLVDSVVDFEESKEKRKRQTELQKNILAHKAKCEKNSKALAKQSAEVYADLTAEALKLKEKDVERKMQQQLEEKLAQVRAQQKMEIAKMVGRMQGANEAIASRGEVDKGQQEKQQFWSAAQSFMAAIKPLGGTTQSEGPKPLKNEITNLEKVKPEGDELVDGVLKSIPQEAVNQGVPSEACLKQRFLKMIRCARGWAGVPPGEITLLQLLLARVQSALYLNIAIPQVELDNEPAIDPEKLNNYDILQRARYYVDRGEFDQAIRYLNLLKGPSSKVASDWVKDALVYLETKQAAEVLLAHATALSMQG